MLERRERECVCVNERERVCVRARGSARGPPLPHSRQTQSSPLLVSVPPINPIHVRLNRHPHPYQTQPSPPHSCQTCNPHHVISLPPPLLDRNHNAAGRPSIGEGGRAMPAQYSLPYIDSIESVEGRRSTVRDDCQLEHRRRANVAHVRQPRPDSGLSFLEKFLLAF